MNKVFLVGNVGRDPEVKYLDQSKVVATFPVATTERGFTTPDGTVVQPQTEWHRVVAWGHSAKFVEQYIKCGNKVFIEGKLSTRSWVDASGITRYTTEVVVVNIEGMMAYKSKDDEVQGDQGAPAPTAPPF
ncbi:MAG: single-stranded DNA-binding protein [Paludibacteraceae bacterium]|nr:single-stranded DNA-binding protein [Paludibacteraceae bacterium]